MAGRLQLIHRGVMRAVLLGTFTAASEATAQDAWSEPGVAVGGGPPPLSRALLSHTLGDGMVLQRAPQSAMIFGYAPAGTTVTTTFDGHALEPLSTADASETWRQALPPTAGGGPPHDIAVSASTGHNATLRGVLFGDVFVCGGQSNMAFSLPANERFADEQLEAAKRPVRTVRRCIAHQSTCSLPRQAHPGSADLRPPLRRESGCSPSAPPSARFRTAWLARSRTCAGSISDGRPHRPRRSAAATPRSMGVA
jgi:hypothetical protein